MQESAQQFHVNPRRRITAVEATIAMAAVFLLLFSTHVGFVAAFQFTFVA